MISISTLAFSNQTLASACSEIESLCCRAEIFSEGLHDVIRCPNDVCLSSYSLSYSLHAPLKNMNLAAVSESDRLSALGIIQKSADFCLKNNIEILVVHPGYTENGSTLLEANAAYLKSLPALQKIAEESGIRLCIENMPKADVFLFQKPNEIDLTGLEFILDIGHAQTSGNLDEFLKIPVDHYHIHDNDGLLDSHLGFGDGVIGESQLEKIVQKAKREKAIMVAEHKTIEEALKTVNALKKAGAL